MSNSILKNLIFVSFASFAFSSFAAPVDVNAADAQVIAEALNGVGIKKAEAIVAYRELNGDFQSAEELVAVKGIGEKTVQKNQADIALSAKGLALKLAEQ